MKKLKCPFCGGIVRIQVRDDEGNLKNNYYESNPTNGLYYTLSHNVRDVPINKYCAIATFDEACKTLGIWKYNTKQEAIDSFYEYKKENK